MKEYEVEVQIFITAENPDEAVEKIQALLEEHSITFEIVEGAVVNSEEI